LKVIEEFSLSGDLFMNKFDEKNFVDLQFFKSFKSSLTFLKVFFRIFSPLKINCIIYGISEYVYLEPNKEISLRENICT
jgi:hypothetical protein